MMSFIDNDRIYAELENPVITSPERIREIFAKAREMKGIEYNEVLALLHLDDPQLIREMYETSRWIKQEIYGNRLVLFAPLYISNLCQNECLYCAFRANNKKLVRKSLSQDEIKEEVEFLLSQGHKRVLLVSGESYTERGLNYIFDSIKTVYSVKTDNANIRRINVNIAPLSVDEFKRLYQQQIGTYQLFQETYHEETYKKLHLKGPKSDYEYRLNTMDRAFEAGFDDVGIGVLFGLADWRYEILALLNHISHLEQKFGLGPHTISVPRLEPALNSEISYEPPYAVSDNDFKKIIAVLRIAVPYTGIILSTRENASMRRAAFDLGISQISAGSRTNPGGYKHDDTHPADVPEGERSQFSLGDSRPLLEVTKDIVAHDHIPSYCTACYRLGRVGKDFMDLAKPGLIKQNCLPNAMLTFAEYLHDFADDELRVCGFKMIDRMIENEINNEGLQRRVRNDLNEINNGRRDLFL
ncbi:MAG: [FeFe] hydrogenase H-cluster radical SAM maturase HydG [Calditrichaceae bacterium]